MATAATPKGSTHNVSTPKAPAVSTNQAAPGASPHTAPSGFHATPKGNTHNTSGPKRSVIPASQKRPDVSPH